MLMSSYSPLERDRHLLIDRLRYFGYTEDACGKRTDEMTLPELEQTIINLEYQRETALEG
ncbi:hypothetical protein [Halobacillus litoralis]|uniref:Fur-regulated basic protein FbpA n=1 Tax=Halobacillus litoralis TaxID=45668 RepID=A0A410MA04_9BACI|nr:hypothetical protein [Halobacillus litoralis]QAS51561.1 hypothetical protein HLI_04640 [Halobacillus litoralis]